MRVAEEANYGSLILGKTVTTHSGQDGSSCYYIKLRKSKIYLTENELDALKDAINEITEP